MEEVSKNLPKLHGDPVMSGPMEVRTVSVPEGNFTIPPESGVPTLRNRKGTGNPENEKGKHMSGH